MCSQWKETGCVRAVPKALLPQYGKNGHTNIKWNHNCSPRWNKAPQTSKVSSWNTIKHSSSSRATAKIKQLRLCATEWMPAGYTSLPVGGGNNIQARVCDGSVNLTAKYPKGTFSGNFLHCCAKQSLRFCAAWPSVIAQPKLDTNCIACLGTNSRGASRLLSSELT